MVIVGCTAKCLPTANGTIDISSGGMQPLRFSTSSRCTKIMRSQTHHRWCRRRCRRAIVPIHLWHHGGGDGGGSRQSRAMYERPPHIHRTPFSHPVQITRWNRQFIFSVVVFTGMTTTPLLLVPVIDTVQHEIDRPESTTDATACLKNKHIVLSFGLFSRGCQTRDTCADYNDP